MQTLSLESAATIVDAALRKARALNLKPMSVAVLDSGGHLVAFKREDGSGILRPQIAQAKAWGTLGLGIGGRAITDRAASHPSFVAALSDISQGRIVPVPGGVLVLDPSGQVIGAVGVTGDLSDHDEACAVSGIDSAGFTPQP